ncbi:MAG: NAD-dependent epimerase/dehydratase family protein [Acetatifactor sp.]|nr:NAD-dependent epimerase/dehydratase family protein [Acetatifactor sp.]
MKHVLIAGANSYIGTSLERYLLEYNASQGRELYRVDTISQRDPVWESYDFRGYDAVFQASGIAHVDTGGVSEEQQALYYQVNCDLAVSTARKAQAAGVGLFLYPSSIIVYGDSAPYGKSRMITPETPADNPHFYGSSKIRAEEELCELAAAKGEDVSQRPEGETETRKDMQIAILRLPMVYGRGSKGNYPLLAKLADRLPFFPDVQNQRSMIYIENLCEFIRQRIEEGQGGLYFPQNAEYTTTSRMVREIAAAHGKKLHLSRIMNPLVALAAMMPGKVGIMANKAFGSLTIDRHMSGDPESYCLYDLQESIRRTER